MKCPVCHKDMRLAGEDTSHNFKTGTNYERAYYTCDTDDVWITAEIPKALRNSKQSKAL